jgi:hypothetical protein
MSAAAANSTASMCIGNSLTTKLTPANGTIVAAEARPGSGA